MSEEPVIEILREIFDIDIPIHEIDGRKLGLFYR